MKILSIIEEEGYFLVLTNNAPRPMFVYLVDKFPDLKSLEKEILKSIRKEGKRNKFKKDKKDKVLSEFNKNA